MINIRKHINVGSVPLKLELKLKLKEDALKCIGIFFCINVSVRNLFFWSSFLSAFHLATLSDSILGS
jgi:hypothetical protein